jgi:dTDP-4-amino-4,6-dideoxygalactose transaminase
VHHLAVVRVPARDQVAVDLAAMGVQTQVHYPIPCHRQVPYLRFADGPLPVAERCAGEVLSLPMFPHMTDDQVEQVCNAVIEATAGKEHQVA